MLGTERGSGQHVVVERFHLTPRDQRRSFAFPGNIKSYGSSERMLANANLLPVDKI